MLTFYLLNVGTAPIDCGDPGTPEDGVKLGDDFRIGATVYYECDGGFELVGPASRVCQPDGLWSGFLPTCQQEGIWFYIAGS